MMPELFKTVDVIATDDCVTIKEDRDAIQKEKEIEIPVQLDIPNKDPIPKD